MEYADGKTLRTYLKKNTNLTWKNKYKFACQIANAVSCLHQTGIVHRDLVILLNILNKLKYVKYNVIHFNIILKFFFFFFFFFMNSTLIIY
jgi:serine/threonine protein kinase